jgi:hypothetical protein
MEPKAERTTVRKPISIKRIERHFSDIEERTQEYLTELAKMICRIIVLQQLRLQKIERLKKNNWLRTLKKKLKGGQPQISTTDQDARPISSRVVVEISYNIQAAG